jgi:predicted nucleic acid-binding protein
MYLLDVNVLLAMYYVKHIHHARTMRWLDDLARSKAVPRFATCSITEIGFVRVAGGKDAKLAESIATARQDLKKLIGDGSFTFLIDELGADQLPDWVRRPAHVTDGHLLALATANDACLVTHDRGIPGALLIPELPDEPLMVREPSIPYRIETRYGSHVN